MSSQRVLVTYATALSFQASDTWKQFFTALRSQLPLRNIHWKSASRPNLRTIQELDISLVTLDSVRDEHTSQIPVTLLEKPLLNIYVVSCEVCCRCNPTYIMQLLPLLGCRDLQNYCQEAIKRLAELRYTTQKPGMAHNPRRASRY